MSPREIEVVDVSGVSFTPNDALRLATEADAMEAATRLFRRIMRADLVTFSDEARSKILTTWRAARREVQ